MPAGCRSVTKQNKMNPQSSALAFLTWYHELGNGFLSCIINSKKQISQVSHELDGVKAHFIAIKDEIQAVIFNLDDYVNSVSSASTTM